MEKAITRENPIHCIKCDSDSIECFDFRDKRVNYGHLLKYYNVPEIIKKFHGASITKMKCTKCNHEYTIDWTKGLPYPLYDDKVLEKFYKGDD